MACAIASCRGKKSKEKSYFRFPSSNPSLRAAWIRSCFRQDAFNVATARICSEHFLESDYDPAFFTRASIMPNVKPWLKEGAIPSQKLRPRIVPKYVLLFSFVELLLTLHCPIASGLSGLG